MTSKINKLSKWTGEKIGEFTEWDGVLNQQIKTVDTDLTNLFIAIQQLQKYIVFGNGSPETVVTAVVGTIFLRLDGGASTTLYVKESGAGTNTGWIGK